MTDLTRLLDLRQPQEEQLIIAFTEVPGFSKACRSQTDAAMVETLQRYYEIVVRAVENAGGMVVKFIGDASLVVFPTDRAADAVAALHHIRGTATPVWKKFDSSCEAQANASVGSVMCGPMGAGDVQRFDVIGKLVNDVAKMPREGIGLSEALRELVEQAS